MDIEEYDFAEDTYEMKQIAILTNPNEANNKEPVLWKEMCEYMEAGDNVIIQTPYIVLSEDMYDDLENVVNESESVEIVSNATETGANPWGSMDYLMQKQNVLDTGVTVNEMMAEDSTHKKVVLIDDNISIVGSYNMDMRSTYIDTEIMLAIDCPELNAQLRKEADQDISQSRKVYPDGTVEYGTDYPDKKAPVGKMIAYHIIKFLEYPVRFVV